MSEACGGETDRGRGGSSCHEHGVVTSNCPQHIRVRDFVDLDGDRVGMGWRGPDHDDGFANLNLLDRGGEEATGSGGRGVPISETGDLIPRRGLDDPEGNEIPGESGLGGRYSLGGQDLDGHALGANGGLAKKFEENGLALSSTHGKSMHRTCKTVIKKYKDSHFSAE